MKFVCEVCGARYYIDDSKVRGKVLRIRCKKCSHIMSVRGLDRPDAGVDPSLQGRRRATEVRRAISTGGDQLETLRKSLATDANLAVASAAEPQPAEHWYYAVSGETYGPYSEDELVDRFGDGRIGDDAYVWQQGFAEWKPAYLIPVFQTAMTQARQIVRRRSRPRTVQLDAADLAAMQEAADVELARRARTPSGGHAIVQAEPATDEAPASQPAATGVGDVATIPAIDASRDLRDQLAAEIADALEGTDADHAGTEPTSRLAVETRPRMQPHDFPVPGREVRERTSNRPGLRPFRDPEPTAGHGAVSSEVKSPERTASASDAVKQRLGNLRDGLRRRTTGEREAVGSGFRHVPIEPDPAQTALTVPSIQLPDSVRRSAALPGTDDVVADAVLADDATQAVTAPTPRLPSGGVDTSDAELDELLDGVDLSTDDAQAAADDTSAVLPAEIAEEIAEEIAAELAAEIAEEPTAEIAEEPTAEIAEEPTAEIAEEPTAEIAEEPTAEIAEEPAEEIAEEIAAEPAADAAEEIAAEPAADAAEEIAAEPAADAAEEIAAEPAADTVDEPTTEVVGDTDEAEHAALVAQAEYVEELSDALIEVPDDAAAAEPEAAAAAPAEDADEPVEELAAAELIEAEGVSDAASPPPSADNAVDESDLDQHAITAAIFAHETPASAHPHVSHTEAHIAVARQASGRGVIVMAVIALLGIAIVAIVAVSRRGAVPADDETPGAEAMASETEPEAESDAEPAPLSADGQRVMEQNMRVAMLRATDRVDRAWDEAFVALSDAIGPETMEGTVSAHRLAAVQERRNNPRSAEPRRATNRNTPSTQGTSEPSTQRITTAPGRVAIGGATTGGSRIVVGATASAPDQSSALRPELNRGNARGPGQDHFVAGLHDDVEPSLQRCHQRQRGEEGELPQSRITLHITVEPTGRVSAVSTDRSLSGSAFERCLQTHRDRWSFPPFDGAAVTLDKTYVLQ